MIFKLDRNRDLALKDVKRNDRVLKRYNFIWKKTLKRTVIFWSHYFLNGYKKFIFLDRSDVHIKYILYIIYIYTYLRIILI